MRTIVRLTLVFGFVVVVAAESPAQQNSVPSRPVTMLKVLPADSLLYLHQYQAAMLLDQPADTSGSRGRNRSRHTRLHACAVLYPDSQPVIDSLSAFFATSPELDYTKWNKPRNEPDWKMNPYLLSWFLFGNRFSDEAKTRFKNAMRWYRDSIGLGGTENHIVNRIVLVTMIDQALGIRDAKTASARTNFRRWVWQRGHRGYMEFNSPMYHVRSLVPVLLLHDFCKDEEMRKLAKKALDAAMAEVALETAAGVRGGPWHRATTSARGMGDGTQDAAYILSAFFFGTCPVNRRSPMILNLLTTSYRAPSVLGSIAAPGAKEKGYEVRHRVATVKPELDAYFYVTDNYVLGCYQNRPPMWANYYGSTNTAGLQPWRLTFTDPGKHIGPYRAEKPEDDGGNTCTAVMQYRNVLLYKGKWMDYTGALGVPDSEKTGDITRWYFAVDSTAYVGITALPSMKAGAVEVGRRRDYASFDAFKTAVRKTALTATDTFPTRVTYTTAGHDSIVFDHGKASVNGTPFSLGRYELVESPYVRSKWNSGIWDISCGGQKLRLDFNDKSVQAGEGLTGEYFRDTNFRDRFMVRNDQTLDYNWQYQVLDTAIPRDTFSVRWNGTLLTDIGGAHGFSVESDGAVSLWVNDSLIVSRPTAAKDSLPISGTINLAKDKHYRVKLEYRHFAGFAKVVVRYAPPLSPEETIGLRGELFAARK